MEKANGKKAISGDNVYVYMTDRYCLPMEYRKRYDNLPFKNKVLLTVNKHEGIECEKILKYKNDECCVGVSAQIQNILVNFCLNILRIGIIYHG